MSRIHPVQVLLDEHELIEKVVDVMEGALLRLERDPAAWTLLTKALDFLEHFADGCHHEREEEVLFPLLRRKGLSGAAQAVLDEHRSGHLHLEAMWQNLPAARGGDDMALTFLCSEGQAYIALMREHIRQEDETLFEVARQVLTAQDIAELDRLFAVGEFHHLDEATYEKYLALGEELAAAKAA